MKLKIPGNLLLLGEFAVTLEGGLGIASTVDKFVSIEVKTAKKLTIHSSHSETLILFTLDQLFLKRPSLEIFVDSSALFKPNGDKMGLGSSAAVVAGLTLALTGLKREDAYLKAIEIHRAFQGGRGSGYDVAASLFGAISDSTSKPLTSGLFIGGKVPTYTPVYHFPL